MLLSFPFCFCFCFAEYFYVFLKDFALGLRTKNRFGVLDPEAVATKEQAVGALANFHTIMARARAASPWVSQFSPRFKEFSELESIQRGKIDSQAWDKQCMLP